MAERAGIEPATDGFIRPLLVLKTSRNTSSILSELGAQNYFSAAVTVPLYRCPPRERTPDSASERYGCPGEPPSLPLYRHPSTSSAESANRILSSAASSLAASVVDSMRLRCSSAIPNLRSSW